MTASPSHSATEDPTSASGDERDRAEHLRPQFLRRLAHDIASPTGVTLTVLDELSGEVKARPELVAMARRSLRRLMRLSEHLALVAELEGRTLEPELASVDARVLAKKALEEALAIDGRRDVLAASDIPSTALPIRADPRLLLVAFREVIGNALKLASSRVEVSVRAEPGLVVFRVDDDGPGFGEDATRALGRRFVRRSAARGLGLSLSMAIEILRAHGGSLSVSQSALPPGRRGHPGAAVVLTLPAGADRPLT